MKTFEHVKIEFCMRWNYAPKAASLAEELFNHFRHNIKKLELVPASGGVFEITVDGEKIYSKKETGVFPQPEDIIEALEP